MPTHNFNNIATKAMASQLLVGANVSAGMPTHNFNDIENAEITEDTKYIDTTIHESQRELVIGRNR